MAGFLVFQKGNGTLIDSTLSFFPPIDLMITMAAFAMMMGSAFVLNQIKDEKNDLHNGKLFFISHGFLKKQAVFIEVAILTALPLLLSILIADYVLLILLALFFLVTGILYNFEPFNLKNTAVAGLVANSFMGIIAFAIGWFHVTDLSAVMHDWDFIETFLAGAVPYALFNTAVYLLTTIPDHDGDRLDGKITFSVRFGIRASIQGAVFLLVLSAVSAWWMSDLVLLIPAVLSLPFFFVLIFSNQTAPVIRAIKYSLFLLTVSISFKFLFYLPLCFLFFFFARWYYRSRFNIVYPNFGNG